jgi:hypothetical protein
MTDSPSKTARVYANTLGSLAPLGVIVLIAGGCSTPGRTKPPEPGRVAVLNNSGRHLDMVSLRGVPDTIGTPARMGSISPVPKGTIQVVERPTPRPPLPKRVVVSWIVHGHGQYEREVSLERILSSSNARTEDSLIFEILPFGRLNAFLRGGD